MRLRFLRDRLTCFFGSSLIIPDHFLMTKGNNDTGNFGIIYIHLTSSHQIVIS